jgi:hypothetical protein
LVYYGFYVVVFYLSREYDVVLVLHKYCCGSHVIEGKRRKDRSDGKRRKKKKAATK